MTDLKKLNSNKNILIAAAVVVVIFIGYFVYQSKKTETVSMNIGGNEISATFGQ